MAKIKKTPAMPLYGKDAYDDETFRLLSFSAQGLYWRLAWWQWAEGSIPETLTAILDGLPRKQAPEIKRAWKEIEPLFPPCGDGRRRSESVERRRAERVKNQEGADATNEKRWNSDTERLSDSDSLSDSKVLSLRAATANANATTPVVNHAQRFADVPKLLARLEAVGVKPAPPEQIAAAWLRDYGEDLIDETVRDVGKRLSGKHFSYLQKILSDRRAKPNERPKPKPEQPSARDFGMRTVADLAAKRKV